jgi:hypothetical protein
MNLYSHTQIRMNRFDEGPRFAPAGQSGDRFDQFIAFNSGNIAFLGDLPTRPNFTGPPRVIITPVKLTKFDGKGFDVMTPVCAARDVTAEGFRLAAYNADPHFGGSSSFNWIAVQESAEASNLLPEVETGVLPPSRFAPFCESFFANRTFHDHLVGGGAGLFDSSVESVQIAATDHGVQGHVVPTAAMVTNFQEDVELVEGALVLSGPGKSMGAHNIDSTAGECAFNWVKFSYNRAFDPASAAASKRSIESGEVAEAWFERGGQPGDWRTWDVTFSGRFANPPNVFLTPTKSADIPVRLHAAVVGMVQAATTSGFRLAARSCDLQSGLAGFNWIAIGN